MKKFFFIAGTIIAITACNNAGETKENTVDTSASSSADSIKRAVESMPKDSLLYPKDSVLVKDTINK